MSNKHTLPPFLFPTKEPVEPKQLPQHTHKTWDWRGPWKHRGGRNVFDSRGEQVLLVNHYWGSPAWDAAAAAHIVACVNACAGAEDPEAYLQAARDAVVEAIKIKTQNAELLELLEELIEDTGDLLYGCIEGTLPDPLWARAHELFAKMKGKDHEVFARIKGKP